MSPTLKPVLVLWASLLAVPVGCHACATISDDPEDSIRTTEEAALILWNAQTRTEHFVRRANFQTAVKDFGFLVPTPSKPELGESSDQIFADLEQELLPKKKIVAQHGVDLTSVFFQMNASEEYAAANSAVTNAAASESDVEEMSVEVVEQKRVGDYDASVLRASDTAALGNWLDSHHYKVSEETREWLELYVRQGYFITAFQIAADGSSQRAQAQSVRLSFQSDEPFYPYREPTRDQKNGAPRSLRVFFIGDTRVDGRIQSDSKTGSWPAIVKYSAPLEENNLSTHGLDVPAGNLHLTAFDDFSSPRPGWGDLRFALASDQSDITPPPHIVHEDRRVRLPMDLLIVGGIVVMTVALRPRKQTQFKPL